MLKIYFFKDFLLEGQFAFLQTLNFIVNFNQCKGKKFNKENHIGISKFARKWKNSSRNFLIYPTPSLNYRLLSLPISLFMFRLNPVLFIFA
jgi:hypothetical protein